MGLRGMQATAYFLIIVPVRSGAIVYDMAVKSEAES